eukprot:204149_1
MRSYAFIFPLYTHGFRSSLDSAFWWFSALRNYFFLIVLKLLSFHMFPRFFWRFRTHKLFVFPLLSIICDHDTYSSMQYPVMCCSSKDLYITCPKQIDGYTIYTSHPQLFYIDMSHSSQLLVVH